jgi:hypothetical protein
MKEHLRQKLGYIAGTAAAATLPGLTFDPSGHLTIAVALITATALFVSAQLIWTSPRSPRMGIALLPPAVLGVAQDLLVWYLLIWFAPVEVDSFWWALAAAGITRAGAWLGLWLLPEERAAAAA